MLGLIVFLLVVWAALAVIGAVIKGLLWLTGVAAFLFVATVIWLMIVRRYKNSRNRPVE